MKLNITKLPLKGMELIEEIDTVLLNETVLPGLVEMTKKQFISLLPYETILIPPEELTEKQAIKNAEQYMLYTKKAMMEVRIKGRGLW